MRIGRVKLFIFLLLLFDEEKRNSSCRCFSELFSSSSFLRHQLFSISFTFHDPSPISTRTRTRGRRRIYRSVIFHEILRATFQLGIRFNVLSFRYLYSRTNISFLPFFHALKNFCFSPSSLTNKTTFLIRYDEESHIMQRWKIKVTQNQRNFLSQNRKKKRRKIEVRKNDFFLINIPIVKRSTCLPYDLLWCFLLLLTTRVIKNSLR